MPLTYNSWDEVDWVREKMRSKMEARFDAKGYVVLFWADMGWVRFFSKERLVSPDEFKKAKLFVWAGEPYYIEVMKGMGYRPVPLETTELLLALNNRMVDAFPVPPLLALAGQLNGPAPNTLDLNDWRASHHLSPVAINLCAALLHISINNSEHAGFRGDADRLAPADSIGPRSVCLSRSHWNELLIYKAALRG